MDRTHKYIGWRTTALYDFPKKKIAVKNKNNEYMIVHNNSIYEIIQDGALEYVVSAIFEDIKPGTRFTVELERNLERSTFSFEIGATGCYAIPRELGFHILSIKLANPSWLTGNYGKDLVNNRGQVTYEFELKATHNNFNDITKIDAGIAIAEPWYPIVYSTTVKEPYASIEGAPVYHYIEMGLVEETFVRVGYFSYTNEDNETVEITKLMIEGIDWYYDKAS
jgi:hypothetical protein